MLAAILPLIPSLLKPRFHHQITVSSWVNQPYNRGPMAFLTPSAGYTLTLRVNLKNLPGTLGKLTTAIGRAGGDLGAVDLVEHRGKVVVRDLSVKCRDEAHGQQIVRAAQRVQGVEVRSVSDRTFGIHAGGKIAIAPRFPLKTR